MPPTVSQLQRLTGLLVGVPPWQGMQLAGPAQIAFTPAFANLGSGQVAAQWRFWKLINEVEIIGAVSLAGALSNNFFIAPYRLPYAPASKQVISGLVLEGNSVAATGSPYVIIDNTGQLQFLNIPVTGTIATRASFHGWYSLDA